MNAPEAPPPGGGAFTYKGRYSLAYAPRDNESPDPGEVVWSWVSFEEDEQRGKDRPIVIVGETTDRRLAALMLSTRDHANEHGWVRVGSGSWDAQGRESWVRTDRVLAVAPHAVRREGSALPRPAFDVLAGALGARRSRPRLLRRLLRRLR